MEITNKHIRLSKELLLTGILIAGVTFLMGIKYKKPNLGLDFLVFPLVQKSLGIEIPVTDLLKNKIH